MELNKLRGRIIEKYGNVSRFAEVSGISNASLSLLLSGKYKWRVDRMAYVMNLLDIPAEEFASFFLPESLAGGNESVKDETKQGV